MTQEQFAAKVGVTTATINRWENNISGPSPLAIRRLKKIRAKVKKVEKTDEGIDLL